MARKKQWATAKCRRNIKTTLKKEHASEAVVGAEGTQIKKRSKKWKDASESKRSSLRQKPRINLSVNNDDFKCMELPLETTKMPSEPIETVECKISLKLKIPNAVVTGNPEGVTCIECSPSKTFSSVQHLLSHHFAAHSLNDAIYNENNHEEEEAKCRLQNLQLELSEFLKNPPVTGESSCDIGEKGSIVQDCSEEMEVSHDGIENEERQNASAVVRYWTIEIIGGALCVQKCEIPHENLPEGLSEEELNPIGHKVWQDCAIGNQFKIRSTHTHGVLETILCTKCLIRFSSVKRFLNHNACMSTHIDHFARHLQNVLNLKEVISDEVVMKLRRTEWINKAKSMGLIKKRDPKEDPIVHFVRNKNFQIALQEHTRRYKKKVFKLLTVVSAKKGLNPVYSEAPVYDRKQRPKKQCPDCLQFFAEIKKHGCKVKATLTCKKCYYSSSSFIEYQNHMSAKHKEKIFRCPECKAIMEKEEVKPHFQDVHGGMEYFMLDRVIRTDRAKHEAALKRKKNWEENKKGNMRKPGICPHCGEAFTKGALNSHIIRKHTFAFPYKCEACVIGFAEGTEYKKHMAKHKNQKFCQFCETYVINLYLHHSTHHGDKLAGGQCTICKKGFNLKDGLANHLRRFKDGSCALAMHERNKRHFCHLCGKGYADKTDLRKHLLKFCPKIKESGGNVELPEELKKKPFAEKKRSPAKPLQFKDGIELNPVKLENIGLKSFNDNVDFIASQNVLKPSFNHTAPINSVSTVADSPTCLKTTNLIIPTIPGASIARTLVPENLAPSGNLVADTNLDMYVVNGIPGTSNMAPMKFAIINQSALPEALTQQTTAPHGNGINIAPPQTVILHSDSERVQELKPQGWEIEETTRAMMSLRNPVDETCSYQKRDSFFLVLKNGRFKCTLCSSVKENRMAANLHYQICHMQKP